MPFEICVRHIEVSEALRAFAIERLEHASRHTQRQGRGRIVLERNGSGQTGSEHRAHVEIMTEAGKLHSESVGPDLRQCIERAADKLETQIGRGHDKKGPRRG